MKKFVFLAATAIAASLTTPAYAQNASPEDRDTAPDANEIIVTATLRKENVQRVPLAVSTFTGENLEKAGVRDVKAFEAVSSSFSVSNSNSESGGTTLRVRGVGTAGNNIGLESAVGVFLDGVYLSRPGIALGDLVDVQQIELLRGPQGTLFGRNTSAGAVSIKTKKPDLGKIEGFANASYGNYDFVNGQAGISIPVVRDRAAIRLSGAYRKRDGYVTNPAGQDSYNRDRYALRGQFYFEPSSDLNFRLIADYAKSNEVCCDMVILRESSLVDRGLFALAGLPANGGVPLSGPQAQQQLSTPANVLSADETRQWGVSGELNYSFGNATLTSITSYRDYRSNTQIEADFVGLNVVSGSDRASASTPNSIPNSTRIRTFSQEFRLTGSTLNDRFEFLVGGYYSNEKIDSFESYSWGPDHQAYVSANIYAALPAASAQFLATTFGPNIARNLFSGGVNSTGNYANNQFGQAARNWSVFTSNTYALSDKLKINAGLRYSDDRKNGSFRQLSASSPACTAVLSQPLPPSLAPLRPLVAAFTCIAQITAVGTPGVGPVPFDKTFKDNELVYTGKVLWQPSANINTYASFTHGYKSGGFNLDPSAAIVSTVNPSGSPTFRSETVNAYEIGIKAKLLDNALTANLAVFRQGFSDFQVLEFTGIQFVTFNVGGVRSQGVELETSIRPSRNLTIGNSITYTDAKYNNDCDRGVFNSSVTPLCGRRLSNSPEWVVVSSIDWSMAVGNALQIGLNGNLRFESDRRTSTQAIFAVAPGTGTITVPSAPGGGVNGYSLSPFDVQDANVKVNLRAMIGSQNGGWALELWATNLFDVRTRNNTSNVPFRGAGTIGGGNGIGVARGAFVQEPRMYGVTARYKF